MRKRHSSAFKAKVVTEALKEEKTIAQLGFEHGIHPNQISAWKSTVVNGMPSLFERESKQQADVVAHQQQLEELYAQIGRLSTQVAWLKKIWPRTWVGQIASRSLIGQTRNCRSQNRRSCYR